jgi:L-fuconolactonase
MKPLEKFISKLSQGDSKIKNLFHSDQTKNSSGINKSGSVSRREFISRAVPIVVASGFALSQKQLSIFPSGYISDSSLMDALTIIDTHTHFFDPTREIPVGRDRPIPWPSSKTSPFYKTTMPPDWEALAKPLGMKGTIVVEAGTNWLEDNDWILKLAESYRSIVGFIGNLSGTAIEQGSTVPVWDNMERYRQEVHRLAKNPIFRGIRVTGRSVFNDLNNGHYPHFEILADAGLVIDVNSVPAADIVALARAVPSLTIVVDHMFGFKAVSSSSDKWRSDIANLGEVQNIVMKVSGLVEGFDSPQTDSPGTLINCRGALDHVYESFGPDRIIFATNWPVSQPKGEMSVITDVVRRYFEPRGKDVLAKVFAVNARKFYKYLDC